MKKKVEKSISKGEIVLNFLKLSKNVESPEYALPTDAGFDLKALEDVSIFPFEQKEARTGIVIEIPKGYVGIVRDRAGIVQKMNVHTVAGTFDSGFRGEVSIMLVNFSDVEVDNEKIKLILKQNHASLFTIFGTILITEIGTYLLSGNISSWI